MDRRDLHDHLHQFHNELERVSSTDPRAHGVLGGLMQDIKHLVHPEAEPAPADASLAERLELIAVQLEAEHPTLAASSRRLVDLLGKAGV